MRVLSGNQPSGALHLGNYFGAIRQFLDLQETHECYFFIASFHALTTKREPSELQQSILDVAASYLALGLDPKRSVLFDQADLPEHHELAWYLSCLAPMGLLQRAHSYKDKVAKGIDATHGLFAYPVLMAADILAYDADLVPVGKDQKQHVEISRDLAIRFNNEWGETLKLPEPYILDESAVVPGIDGEKMSKSYENTIDIFAGYGGAKKALLAKVEEKFGPLRETKQDLLSRPDDLHDVLADGAERARESAGALLEKVREAVGFAARPRSFVNAPPGFPPPGT
jgi:tryptophanyl-tRNA synthetase